MKPFKTSVLCPQCKTVTIHTMKETGNYKDRVAGVEATRGTKRFELLETCDTCGNEDFTHRFLSDLETLRRNARLEAKQFRLKLKLSENKREYYDRIKKGDEDGFTFSC